MNKIEARDQDRISWGSRGSSSLSLRPTISYHSMPCGRPTLSQHNSRYGVGHPQGEDTIFFQRPPLKYGPARDINQLNDYSVLLKRKRKVSAIIAIVMLVDSEIRGTTIENNITN
jgi:hypothetical protein